MRKLTAILLNLPEIQQAKLADWLLGGMPYHEAKVLVEKEFGVTVKSLSAFWQFWDVVCAPHVLAKRKRLVKSAAERAEEAKREPGQFDAATKDAIQQKAYEVSINPKADPKEVKAIMMLMLKVRDQELEERKIVLLEKKAAAFDQAKEVVESTLTPEQQRLRLKEILK